MTTQEFTPANPSITATRRIPDPYSLPNTCPHCSGVVTAEHNSVIYGRAYGQYPWIYMCNGCRAYVGMHPDTNIALGTLANDETRQARKECKPPFLKFCHISPLNRRACYTKLAEAMNLPKEECHFGLFNVEQCNRAKVMCDEWLEDLRQEGIS